MSVSADEGSSGFTFQQRAELIAAPGNTILRLPNAIVFGCGTIEQLGAVTSSEGRRALVCSDPGVSHTEGYERAIRSLVRSGIATHTYTQTPADVPVESAHECVGTVSGKEVDVIVGIGGGSALDMAKLAALLLSHGEALASYYGEERVPGPCLPVIAVPTTAGTGSEVTPVAVLRDPDRPMKIGISSRHLIPSAAVCDPELTLTCPPATTAYAGIDALVHAIEAYTAAVRQTWGDYPGPVFRGKSYFSDLHALGAIELIHGALERAVFHGDDLDARTMMLLGSLSAGIAFAQAGTAGAHALQYPLGARTSTPHGLGVGLLAPYVLNFVRPKAERELAIVGRAMGVCDDHADEAEAALLATEEISRLVRAIGLPESLAELSISEADLSHIADEASTIVRLVDNSPRKLDREALVTILRAAWSGDGTQSDGGNRPQSVDFDPQRPN